MKRITKLLITLPFVAAMLTGCVKQRPQEESKQEESVSEVISESTESIESTSVEESTEPEVISEESSEEISEELESEESFTAEGVIQDICLTLFQTAVLGENYFSDGQNGFYTGVNFGNYGEEYLALATTTVINNLPEYCVEVVAPHEDTWDDGEKGVFATYVTNDESVVVQIGSYIYNSKLCAQINVF